MDYAPHLKTHAAGVKKKIPKSAFMALDAAIVNFGVALAKHVRLCNSP
jgi:hypothetical protein